jgi:hypothetical protein
MEGWVKIHRKVMDNEDYFCEPFCRNMAWIDLLLLANHKTKFIRIRGIKVEVKRGQIGYTSENLGLRWKWSRGKVLRYLTELQKSKQIVQQKNNVTTLISILNYDKYQDGSTADSTTNGTASSTTERQQTVQQTDINKNVNNEKNVENDNNIIVEFKIPPVESLVPAVKKPKTIKTPKQPNPLFKNCVGFWLGEIHKGWIFTDAKGKALKGIIEKIKQSISATGEEPTDAIVFTTFKVICKKLPEWFKDKDLDVINGKYNEIIEQIKNANNGTVAKPTGKESIFRT